MDLRPNKTIDLRGHHPSNQPDHKNQESTTEKITAFLDRPEKYEALEAPADVLIEEAHTEDVSLFWEGSEYEQYKHDRRWYVVASLLLAGIISYAVFTDSLVMAITFILIGVVGYIYLTKEPRHLEFRIDTEGVWVGNELYSFDDMESFWIFYEPPTLKELSIQTRGSLLSRVQIPIHDVDPNDIRNTLVTFVPEEKHTPTLIDTIERVLHI